MKIYVRLPLEGTTNTRDLGGYPTKDGSVTQFYRFFRSDDLANITANDRQFLRDLNLKTIIDLRTHEEIKMSPTPFINDPELSYHHISLMKQEQNTQLSIADLPYDILMRSYIDILSNRKDLIKAVFDVIKEANEGSILYHCMAGKDRTGVISMLMLGICGVSSTDIITNYEVTYTNLQKNQVVSEMTKDLPKHVMYSDPKFMVGTLDFLYTHYDNFENYFYQLGFDDVAIEKIRARLLD